MPNGNKPLEDKVAVVTGAESQRYGATVALAGAGHNSDLVLKGFILIRHDVVLQRP